METTVENSQETGLELNTVQSDKASSLALITNDDNMKRVMVMAEAMASSKITVPKHLQGSVGDCMAIVIQSSNWGMNPFAVAQKTHIVNGTLGYEAQLVNAVVQESNAISGRFHYEYTGDGKDIRCRVGAKLRGEEEITWGEWLRNGDVTIRNSPLWVTNPKQQLGYLQVKNWARLHAPGAILGVYTPDELQEKEINPRPRSRNGGDIATAAKEKPLVIDAAEEDHRNQLCAALQLCAEEGMQSFLTKWKAIGKANKADALLIGEPEFNRLQEVAKESDEKAVQQ